MLEALHLLQRPASLAHPLPELPTLAHWMWHMRRLHFVGIGGIGMSGIAELLHGLGFIVSGSDQVNSPVLQRLQSLGITVYHGHRSEHVAKCDVLVASSAIDEHNPEVSAARKRGIVIIPRAQMLAEMMRFKYGIAVTGSHGKTTTTSLLVSLLSAAELDPTFIIGGRLTPAEQENGIADGIDYGANARLGKGRYLVAEADESDATFLHLQPVLAVVTNIDNDHLQAYGGTLEGLQQAFVNFLHNLPFYGLAVLCSDGAVLNKLRPEIARSQLSYGIDEVADVNASDIVADGYKMHFRVHLRYRQEHYFQCSLNMLGRHNVLNALAAITVATELGVSQDTIVKALAVFPGIKRRLQRYGDLCAPNGSSFTLVDDYAHHPRELQVTLAAISECYVGRRMVVVFQPHRFTRLRDLLTEFALVLTRAEVLILVPVYAANETAIDGINAVALAALIEGNKIGHAKPLVLDSIDQVIQHLPQVIVDGDVMVTLGAGDIGYLARRIQQQFGIPK